MSSNPSPSKSTLVPAINLTCVTIDLYIFHGTQGLYQDIVSYEQMVESVGSKALELAEKSPANRATVDTSQVQTRYNSVKEQAKVAYVPLSRS